MPISLSEEVPIKRLFSMGLKMPAKVSRLSSSRFRCTSLKSCLPTCVNCHTIQAALQSLHSRRSISVRPIGRQTCPGVNREALFRLLARSRSSKPKKRARSEQATEPRKTLLCVSLSIKVTCLLDSNHDKVIQSLLWGLSGHDRI
jgi:hypothetical protein